MQQHGSKYFASRHTLVYLADGRFFVHAQNTATNGNERLVIISGSVVPIISLYWKKRFSREHTKNPNASIRTRPDITFLAVG